MVWKWYGSEDGEWNESEDKNGMGVKIEDDTGVRIYRG